MGKVYEILNIKTFSIMLEFFLNNGQQLFIHELLETTRDTDTFRCVLARTNYNRRTLAVADTKPPDLSNMAVFL